MHAGWHPALFQQLTTSAAARGGTHGQIQSVSRTAGIVPRPEKPRSKYKYRFINIAHDCAAPKEYRDNSDVVFS